MIEKKKAIDIVIITDGISKEIDDVCIHPGHQPPTHLYIPPGKVFEHECPACGSKQRMLGSLVRF